MASYTRVNLDTLRDRLTERVGNNTTFWTLEEKGDAINEALEVWQCLTGEFVGSLAIPVLGTAFYEVPHQIISPTRVLHNSIPLTLISLWELDNGFPGWQTTTGTPLFWSPVGLNKVALYPTATTGLLTFEGYQELQRLRAGDFVQLGEEELNVILDYAHHYCTVKEGTSELEATSGLLRNFYEAAALRNRRVAATTFYRRAMGLPRDEVERAPRTMKDAGGVRG